MIFRTIRVWLYRTRIRIWYVPYAYGTKYAYGIEHAYNLDGAMHILLTVTPLPEPLPCLVYKFMQYNLHY